MFDVGKHSWNLCLWNLPLNLLQHCYKPSLNSWFCLARTLNFSDNNLQCCKWNPSQIVVAVDHNVPLTWSHLEQGLSSAGLLSFELKKWSTDCSHFFLPRQQNATTSRLNSKKVYSLFKPKMDANMCVGGKSWRCAFSSMESILYYSICTTKSFFLHYIMKVKNYIKNLFPQFMH